MNGRRVRVVLQCGSRAWLRSDGGVRGCCSVPVFCVCFCLVSHVELSCPDPSRSNSTLSVFLDNLPLSCSVS